MERQLKLKKVDLVARVPGREDQLVEVSPERAPEAGQALEIMGRRHALRVSNSSRILEARCYLAAGDLAPAQKIAAVVAAPAGQLARLVEARRAQQEESGGA